MQLTLFHHQNAETFFHVLEHLIALKIEQAGFDIDAFSNSRYVGLSIKKAPNISSFVNSTTRTQLTPNDREIEITSLIEEYKADQNNLRLHAKYKALFSLSIAEMLDFQIQQIGKITLTDQDIDDWLKEFSPLNQTKDLSRFQLCTKSIPSAYSDPTLKLKSHIVWHKHAFAFVKKCVHYADAKSTIHLLSNLEDRGVIEQLKYTGIIEGHLVMLGETLDKEIANTKMKDLLNPQSLHLLPPMGRKTHSYIIREAELTLAFPGSTN